MKTQLRAACVKVGLVAATLGLSFVAAPVALAQPQSSGPHVIVNPSFDLPETAEVTVEIRGFEPEEAVFIQQCAQVDPSLFGCDYTNTESFTVNEEGEGEIQVTINRVFEANDDSGDDIGEVDCADEELGCLVAVGNFEGGSGASIHFASDETENGGSDE